MTRLRLAIAGLAVFFLTTALPAATPHWRDEFSDRRLWQDWQFSGVAKTTSYAPVAVGSDSALRIAADHSASALLLAKPFTLAASERIRLRWRWRVDVAPKVVEARSKSGDDYAVRIYVIFEQPEQNAGWLDQWALRQSPLKAGGYLPERSLVYVWTEQAGLRKPFASPYTPRQMMIPLPYRASQRGRWAEADVTPLADYQAAFNRPAPRRFRLAIMGDADNSGSTALAWLDWIELEVVSR